MRSQHSPLIASQVVGCLVLNKPSKKGKATAISSRTSKTKSASRTKRHSSGALLTVAEQDVVEGREDGAGKDVSPAASGAAANTDATAVLRLLREHVVHARVPVLPPQEPRQAAAAAIRMGLLVQLYYRYEAGAKLSSAIRAIALTAPGENI